MRIILIICLFIIAATGVRAQKLTVPELVSIADGSAKGIDTTLKKKGYMLMKKDIDSAGALYEYSNFDVEGEKNAANIHSLTYMDVTAGDYKSRLVTYRTYNKEEYQDIATYLLSHNYHKTGFFDFKESKHTLYSNGQQTIRIKVIDTELKKSRQKITAYELELGK